MVHVMDGSWAPWPAFDDEQVEAAARVLRSGRVNYWTGTEGREFEREFAEYTGVRHAVFVANGTVGLEAALEALALPAGSQVVTTPRTFIATSSAIVRQGLVPVFADVDPDSGCITAATIQAALTPATSAVVVVHLGGWPADVPEIRALCDERGLRLVEDCAQAHGAMVGDRHVGTYGDISVWSFCQDKIITTGGEGGMIGTDDDELWRRAWAIKDHGKSWEAVYERAHPPGFRWLHEGFGTNYRGTEVQAAIGRIQYRRLDEWRRQRTANADALRTSLQALPALRVPVPRPGLTHAYYRLYADLDPAALSAGWTRDRVLDELGAVLSLPVLSGSCPEIYREEAFRASGLAPAAPLPVAHALSHTSLAFLVHPGLSPADMSAVGSAVTSIVGRATTESP